MKSMFQFRLLTFILGVILVLTCRGFKDFDTGFVARAADTPGNSTGVDVSSRHSGPHPMPLLR